MFGLFSPGKKFLGVDIGTSAIKAVEIEFKKQRPVLTNYAEIQMGKIQDQKYKDLETRDQQIVSYLKKMIEHMHISTNSCYAAIPGFTGLVTLIEFPEMEREELKQAINYEAHRYVPTTLDEVSLSWDVVEHREEVDQTGKKVRKIQVLLVAAPKKEVEHFEKIMKDTGLKVNSLELEIFAMVRSLIGDDLGVYVIIDVGGRTANILLVERGIIKINRNLDTGGDELTNTLSESMNISWQRAEAMKKQDRNFFESREMPISFHTIELVANETLRIINTYKSRNKDGKINQIILSGGSAKLKGLDRHFSKILGIEAVVGNPWKRLDVNRNVLSSVMELGPSFSVAVGLALRGVEDSWNN